MIEMWRAYLTALSVRQWSLIGAVLLIVVSGAYLLWTDAEEPAVIVQRAENVPPVTEIKGLSAAAAKTPLRNPFSAAHERVGEIPQEAAHERPEERALLPAVAPTASASPIPPPAVPAPPAPPPLVLRGVVQGADGSRMDILAEGTEAAALGIGDTWRGYTLCSATDTSATLDSASGTITLTRE